jgi:hypothetical protein
MDGACSSWDATAGKFVPGDMTETLPRGNDAKCGFGCHTIVKGRDYVFAEYGPRERGTTQPLMSR